VLHYLDLQSTIYIFVSIFTISIILNNKQLHIMKSILLVSALSLLTFFACKSPQTSSVAGEKFGKEITAENAVDLPSVIAKLESQDSVRTKFTAKVESVCQTKGCWMNLVPTTQGEDEIFVKFKDYAFFMPLDIAGKNVIVEGVAFKEVTPVDELKHYAEDEGLSQEEIDKITEPKEEWKFMADGVIVL